MCVCVYIYIYISSSEWTTSDKPGFFFYSLNMFRRSAFISTYLKILEAITDNVKSNLVYTKINE